MPEDPAKDAKAAASATKGATEATKGVVQTVKLARSFNLVGAALLAKDLIAKIPGLNKASEGLKKVKQAIAAAVAYMLLMLGLKALGALAGAAVGAAIGFMIAGPPGAIIGGLIGGYLGWTHPAEVLHFVTHPWSLVAKPWHYISSSFQGLGSAIGSSITSAISSITSAIANAISSAAGSVFGAISSATSFVVNAIPSISIPTATVATLTITPIGAAGLTQILGVNPTTNVAFSSPEEDAAPLPAPAPGDGGGPGGGGGQCGPVSGSPLPDGYIITSGFGPGHPLGVDVAMPGDPEGIPVYSTFSSTATVVFAGWYTDGYGYAVILRSGQYQTLYAHLAYPAVSTDDQVAPGAQIGVMDDTGRSEGNHVHYEVRFNGQLINPRNCGV